ncbi:MAG: COR domain-containing protein, partial [Armatimonadota bacterium]
GIYRLLNAPALASTKGVLTLADLGKLLPTEDYPVEKHAFLLELMRKFKLCFAFPDEQGGRYLVPELLDKQEPDLGTEFDPRSCLNFEYSYDIQPEGLLPGFIVRSNVLSEGQPRWRSGVVLEWGGCRALVRADVAASRITIHVRGGEAAERRELLAVIRSDFERMHREIIALQVTALVPVPDHPQTRVEYDRLVAFEREGYDEHRELIDGKVFTLSVKQLLGGVDLAPPPARGAARTGKDEALKLFISYSHKDEAFRERLEVHLKLLERTEKIAPWHDRRLLPGDDWKGQIDRNMETADIILLLVSADFIASDYCYDTEMDCMLKRASAGESRIVPIIVNDCDWTTAPFARVQALPSGARPVAVWSNAESAWTDVAKGIRSVINDIRRVAPPWSEQRLMLRSVELVNICCFGQSRLDLATEGSPCQFGLVFGPNSIGKTTLLRSIAIGLCDPPNAERLISMMPGDLMRSGEGEGLIALELTDSEGQQGWRLETHISRTSDGQLDVRFAGAPELDRSRLFVCGYGAARHGLGTQDFTAYSHHLAVNTLFDYGAPLQNPELALRRAQDNGGDTTRLLSQIDSVLMLEPRATSLGPNGITVSGPWGDGMPRTALGDGYQATLAWLADMLGWAACHAPEALADQLAGIVLIDELEQHLHPAWQRELVLLLSTHFPKVQFIAASHAPLCAVGMTALPDSSGRIFTVRQDETGAKVETFGLPRGQRADQVLTSPIFGLFSASDFGIEADIDRYIQLSSESGRTDAEDEEMAKLEQRLYRIMGPFQTELDIELERAVQDVLRSRVALELEKGALSETGLNLKVRRRLQDLFGAEVHNGKDRLS